ncbi:heterogeneous nuclear ribonucleoprotein 1 [Silene latifolia]|uniref:heterogeneous nuclear ribonucleoprotein 1 n=1 Tax=Silene latifolia TaxID=37657 RepID=UPI003D7898A7
MDGEQGKLFVGGISYETSEDRLKEYFGQYGEVLQANIMRDKTNGRPRGFGFVLFSDPSVIDSVLQDKHNLDGRQVEAKRAMSREDQQNTTRTGVRNGGGGGGNIRTKKIFVGGLPPSLSDEGFRQYFEGFGHVTDVVIMYDQNTQRPRGFGFISFDSEDAVDRVLENTFHDLDGKQVEVKRALPKDANSGVASRGGNSGGYGYNNSSGNQNSYDSRMDSNRYMQPQNMGAGFPPYSSSAYGAAGYGYGSANSGMGYGGYPGYGAAANAAYGNPNVPSVGYGAGLMGAPRSLWNAQAASGYGVGQLPSGVSGYGSQGYGYGSYGRGSNTSGYTDANSHGAYTNGALMGYGGGYGGAQSRQVQQQ